MRAFVALAALSSLALVLAGCSARAPTVDEEATAEAGRMSSSAEGDGGIVTAQRQGDLATSVRAADVDFVVVGHGDMAVGVEAEALAGAIAEMAWTPNSPASESLELQVFLDGKPLASVSGPSPLRLAFPGDALGGDAWLHAASPGPAGAHVAQSITFYLTTFDGVPFDPTYTALPA